MTRRPNPESFLIVLVTAPDLKTARKLARVALERRLVACANLIPRIESHYWWEGRIESGAEVMLIMKTTRRHVRDLERAVLANHPYDTPEFVVVGLQGGNRRYLEWLGSSVAPIAGRHNKRR